MCVFKVVLACSLTSPTSFLWILCHVLPSSTPPSSLHLSTSCLWGIQLVVNWLITAAVVLWVTLLSTVPLSLSDLTFSLLVSFSVHLIFILRHQCLDTSNFFFFFGSSALSCPRFFCLPKCHCSRLIDSSPICYFPYNFQTRKLYWCDQSLCCPLHKDLLHCSFIFILVFGWLPLPPSQLSDKFLSLPQSSVQTLPPLLLADAFPALLHQENRSHWTWTISWYLLLCLPFHRPPHINHSPPSFSS